MIPIGFFSDIEACYKSFPASDQPPVRVLRNSAVAEKILKYMQSCMVFMTGPWVVSNTKGEIIDSYVLRTDGEYIWPRYFEKYFSENPDLWLPEKFEGKALNLLECNLVINPNGTYGDGSLSAEWDKWHMDQVRTNCPEVLGHINHSE